MLNFSNHTAGAPADTEGSLSPSPARRLEDEHGGTVGAVIDLARDHRHLGILGVIHAAPGHPDLAEVLSVPPAGFRYELHCSDCKSTVTLFSNPPSCLEGAYLVEHSPSCPWLGSWPAGSTR